MVSLFAVSSPAARSSAPPAARGAAPPDAPGGAPAAPSRLRLAVTVAGLLITLLLAALDATIVATALPRIVADFGGSAGLGRYTWITTAYLLGSTLAVPIVGKLADQFGRRPLLVGGTLLFLAASLLCSLAGGFEQLVAFRVLQGIGGGAITAAVFAAVPALFAPAARARLVGLFTGTYALASIVGPPLGGAVTDAVGWRGVFAINLPLGLLALGILLATYPRRLGAPVRPLVDYPGAACLVLGFGPLLLALSLGGHALAWGSPPILALLALGAFGLAALVWVERRAAEPVIPLGLLASRGVGIPALGMVCLAAGLFATVLFTPLFLQGVAGRSPTASGGALAPLMLASVLASVLIGQLIARLGRTRPTGVGGLALAALGVWLLAGMDATTDGATVTRNLTIVGFGLGAALASFAVAAQNAVPVQRSGVATALGAFSRAIGSTLASAGLGAVLAARLAGTTDSSALAAALHMLFLVVALVLAAGAALALFQTEPLAASAAERASRPALQNTSEWLRRVFNPTVLRAARAQQGDQALAGVGRESVSRVACRPSP